MISIQFFGAANTVTGSKYLVSSRGTHVLVDCGMFQGLKSLRLRNWDALPLDAKQIHAVILTHAHIDHSGYLPRLIKDGFRGKVYSTAATKDLCEILLPDAGYLAEEEAAYLNKHKKTKHNPALPLFTIEDAKKTFSHFEPVDFEKDFELRPGFRFQFRYAGHILGAASVSLHVDGKKILFTGDIGRPNDPIFFGPQTLSETDYLITESTYGDRHHGSEDVLGDLEKIIRDTVQKRGVIIIPSFAVGRAQTMMYYLWKLKKQKRIPDIPMYLNSPMATDVNKLFIHYHQLHRLSEREAKEVCHVVKYVRSEEDSRALNAKQGPMLIISASGMVSGGRVLHHIKRFGPEKTTTILLVGFQAAGTRGEALEKGTDEIKIHGEYVPIKAQIKVLENMSAHADYKEILQWFSDSKISPKKVFITHGEPSAADSLRRRLTENFGWKCVIPEQDQKFELD